jgi:hypothetical protein
MWILSLAGAFGSASVSAASSAKAPSFDGSWTLVAQTTEGHCGYSNFDITIRQGIRKSDRFEAAASNQQCLVDTDQAPSRTSHSRFGGI